MILRSPAATVGMSLLLGAPSLLAAPALPPPPHASLHVTVDNTAANPVVTRPGSLGDIAKALVGSAFQTTLSVPETPGERCLATYQVPPGKRFRVTFLSFWTTSGAPETFMEFGSIYLSSQRIPLYFPTPPAESGVGIATYAGAQALDFYANPGETITLNMVYSTDRGSPQCIYTLSGQLVDYP